MAPYRPQKLNLRGSWKEQGTGACLPRQGLRRTEVRCVWEDHERQAGPGLCLDPQILRTVLRILCVPRTVGTEGGKEAAGLCENLADTLSLEGLKVCSQKVFWRWLLSLFMAHQDQEFWGVPLSKDRNQDI